MTEIIAPARFVADKDAVDRLLARCRRMLQGRGFELVVAAALVGAAVPRLWALFFDDSVFYPDEIFQTLEQGHRAAFGYGFIPWEFREAARSWLLPGALAGVLKLGAALGISSGFGLAHFAKGFMVLLSLTGAYAVVVLARDRGGLSAAMIAGALYAALPPLVVFGARCTTETASIPAITFATLWVLGSRRGALRACGAGALLGAAVFLRSQNGLIALSLLVALLVGRRWREARAFTAGGAVAALLAGGVLDWLTWGAPFRAALVYLRFSLLEGKPSLWGTAPWWFYASVLGTSCGPLLAVLLIGFVAAARRERALVALVLVYFVAHSAIPHKEFRFMVPILPVALSAAAIGLAELERRLLSSLRAGEPSGRAHTDEETVIALALALVLATGLGLRAARDRYEDFGAAGRGSVWKSVDGATLLIAYVGARRDLCGLMLDGIDRGYTGAYSYLHRNVPFFNDTFPESRQSANYLVAPRQGGGLPGYQALGSSDGFTLFRRPGGCAPPPPSYSLETGDDPMKP